MSGQDTHSRKGIWGWMFFDFAAQPFFTVVTTFIFGPYVVARMVDDPVTGQSAWSLSIAIAGVVIALLSPILGSIADSSGPRKPWIMMFAVIKISCLLILSFAAPGSSLVWVLGIFIIATAAAEFSIVFNDSMMTHVVPEKEIGRVSNIAFGLGYLGGMIVLIIVIAFMSTAPGSDKTIIGLDPILGLDGEKGEAARATGPFGAMFYLVFVLPMFIFTADRAVRSVKLNKAIKSGLANLKDTIGEARQRSGLFRFLIARMLYQDGVTALLTLGAVFAASMFAWETTELGVFGIILNIVAIPSCFIAARLDTMFGSRTIIMVSIIMLAVATAGIISTGQNFTLFGLINFEATSTDGMFSTPAEMTYIGFGLLIGAAFGPIQASSRAYLAASVLPEETGRYFGLYALVGRATSFVAPAAVAAITFATDSQRSGMAIIILFFVAGFIIMLTAPKPAQNKEAAIAAAANA